MLESTFRCPGVGPSRERELWARGVRLWPELPRSGLVLSPRIDDRLRAAVDGLRELAERGDVAGLASRIPVAEHWRLWPRLGSRTCFLDVESDGRVITAVGVLDGEGLATFLHGRNLATLPERLAASEAIVTFNGHAFDLPVLKRSFESLRLPPVRIDLRHLWRRLGVPGGLKSLEKAQGLTRPASIEGCDGRAAVRLWREWDENRSARSLHTLVEYNLYDALMLRPLLDLGYNGMVERLGLPHAPVPVFQRAELLYDVSRILGGL